MVELPRYKQVYETLRRHIADGVYSAGDLLPSEHELSIVHHVARPTVRRALDQLVADGFILKHQGKGSIVKGAPKGIGILSLSGTTSAVGRENFLTHILIKPEVNMRWDASISSGYVCLIMNLCFLILRCCPTSICPVLPRITWKTPRCSTF